MNLRVENLSFSYPKGKVLNNISFDAHSGEFITLLGKNGAGKTTLFRSLLGILKSEGKVIIDGTDISKLPPREKAKRIAYIPQETRQVFAYTVQDAVLMGCTPNLSSMSSPKEKDVKMALKALETLGIMYLKDRNVNELSGGERQLVLCARALASSASCLVFDEPTASLDLGNQTKVLKTISFLTKNDYLAIVSTHNLGQALNYSSRIIMLDEGKIVFDNTPQVLAESPILKVFYGINLSVEKHNNWFVVIPK